MSFAAPAWLALLAVVAPLVWLLARRGPAMPPGRRNVFLALRAGALVLLVGALASPRLVRRTDTLDLVLVLDASDSVDEEARGRALDLLESVRARLRPRDTLAVLPFGAEAGAEIPVLAAGRPTIEDQGVNASATDIGGALQAAIAQAASGTRRILVASDGIENRGSAVAAASLAHAAGVEVHVLPLAPSGGGEVLVQDLLVAEPVRAGEPREATVVLRSRQRTPARLVVARDGEPIGVRQLLLEPGESAVRLAVTFAEPGLATCTAVVQAADDRLAENNRFQRLVEVAGNPSVLYVSRPERRSSALLAALAAQGIGVVERDPGGIAGTLAGFLPYDAVILDDVPAFSFSVEKMETLEQYVRDAGGGLLMIGGDHSFGAGGWYETPVERVLPVDMDVKSQAQTPRLALVIVTDKSGSMGGTVSTGESKLDLVKAAALSALDLLNPFDRAGLLAFDADWEWTVPIVDASERELVARDLASLSAGGGTIMLPALEEAHRTLAGVESALKHVIVLTDGLTNAGDFAAEVAAMRRDRITVSTVAVGSDADRDLLANIARWGGGRSYATDDARSIPRIFVAETLLASRGLIAEERFLPTASVEHEVLRGIAAPSIPMLEGYVLTYPKAGADRVLGAPRDAPLLATWRYGLGRAAAFTSDLAGRWGRAWLDWEAFPRFAAQLVRWIESAAPSAVLHPEVSLAAGRGSVAVDAWDALGAFVGGLTMSATIIDPRRERQQLRLPQTGPGRYEGSFRADRPGDYVITIAAGAGAAGADGGEAAPLVRTVGASLPYPEEYRDAGVDQRLLARIAGETGGGVVDPDDLETLDSLVRRPSAAAGAGEPATPLWPFALALALGAFFLDIATRRFMLPEGLREKLARFLGGGRRASSWSYEELAAMVSRAREEERRRLRERISGMVVEGRVDPDLAAYLYLARMKGKRKPPGGRPAASETKEG